MFRNDMRDHKKLRAFELPDEMSKAFLRDEIYGIISQMRRTIVSVPSNIVEGCAPESQAEYIRFLDIASYSYGLNTYSLKPYTLTT